MYATPSDPLVHVGFKDFSSSDDDTAHEQEAAKGKFTHLGRVFYLKKVEMQKGLDPFTGYTQALIAQLIFGENIPQEPPDETTDTPDLYEDKLFYWNAITQSRLFLAQDYEPLVDRITKRLEPLFSQRPAAADFGTAFFKEPNLVIHQGQEARASDWSGEKKASVRLALPNGELTVTEDESLFLAAIHIVLHLKHYIAGIVINYKDQERDFADKTLLESWEFLCSPDLASLCIKEWSDELAMFEDFPSQMRKVLEAWDQVKSIFV